MYFINYFLQGFENLGGLTFFVYNNGMNSVATKCVVPMELTHCC